MQQADLRLQNLFEDMQRERKTQFKTLVESTVRKRMIESPVSFTSRILKLVSVKILGIKMQALFDSGALPDSHSQRFDEDLSVAAYSTNETLTVASEDTSNCVGIITGLSVNFDKQKENLTFLVIADVSSNVIIGCLTFENFKMSTDLMNRMVTLAFNGTNFALPVDHDLFKVFETAEHTAGEEFTFGTRDRLSSVEELATFTLGMRSIEDEPHDVSQSLSHDSGEALPVIMHSNDW